LIIECCLNPIALTKIFPKEKKEKKKALKIEKHIKREWKEELTDRECDCFSKFAGFFSV